MAGNGRADVPALAFSEAQCRFDFLLWVATPHVDKLQQAPGRHKA